MKKTVYEKDCKARLHITKSNSKLGNMASLGYIPSNDTITLKSGILVSDCKGTCGKVNCSECKKNCYAIRSYRQYNGKTVACIENTIQMRETPLTHFDEISNYIKENNVTVFRYLESGEIESYRQFEYFVDMVKNNPETLFYMYTKNYDVLFTFFFVNMKRLPQNLIILLSVWGETGKTEFSKFERFQGIKCFAVNSNLPVDCFCPAYSKDENGKAKLNKNMTCEKCGLCFRSTAKIIGCFEH